MSAQEYPAPDSVSRLQQRALVVGVIGVVLCIIGYAKSPALLLHSYLMAFLFVLGLSLGSLGLLMLQHLTGGKWGIIIRRPLESATRSIPLLFVLFVPIFFGMKYLYFAWLTAPATGEGALSSFQQSYLTMSGFRVRAVIYFAVWLILMFLFNHWSREQDVNRDGWPGNHPVRIRNEFCSHRLGHVAVAALGVDHLWVLVCGRPTYFLNGADDRGGGAVGANRAVPACAATEPLARFG